MRIPSLLKVLLFNALLAISLAKDVPSKAPPEWKEQIKDGLFLFEAKEPHNTAVMTSIGNGYIGTVIGSDAIYLAGVYNGLNTVDPSHRAKIPAVHNVILSGDGVHEGGCGIDLQDAIYYRRMHTFNATIDMRWYAHRSRRSILVFEIVVNNTVNMSDVTFFLSSNTSQTNDFNLTSQAAPDGLFMYNGTIVTPEDPNGTIVSIGVVGDVLPGNLSVKGNTSTSFYFLAAFRSSLDTSNPLAAALADYKSASANTSMLKSDHITAWNDLWNGRIGISGNLKLQQVTNAAQYYILSSMRSDWPWSLSPGSLSSNAYNGHVFWDAETWMYPSVLFTNPELARGSVLQYRINNIKGAARKAKGYGPVLDYEGLMYPWESAFTGDEVCPSSAPTGQYEQHISGDIAFAFRQYWYLKKDVEWLKNAWPVIYGIAFFWETRVMFDRVLNQYVINGVIPPDEDAGVVNNSVYTNVVAKMSFDFAIEAGTFLNKTIPPKWATMSANIRIPEDAKLNIHLEYDKYNGSMIKQADVVLLGFPLGYPMTPERRRADLLYYANRTKLSGPAMTWPMHMIGWLELKDYDQSDSVFNQTFENAKLPFYVWTECADGSGASNFISGAGGFLQSILFGYAGIRLGGDTLKFDPVLPPNSTGVSFGRIHYLGNDLSISYDANTMTILKTNVDGQLLEFGYSEDRIHDALTVNTPIVVPRGSFKLSPTKNVLFWGFPIRFWIVFGVLAAVGVLMAIGIGFIVARRKPASANKPQYKPIPQRPLDM